MFFSLKKLILFCLFVVSVSGCASRSVLTDDLSRYIEKKFPLHIVVDNRKLEKYRIPPKDGRIRDYLDSHYLRDWLNLSKTSEDFFSKIFSSVEFVGEDGYVDKSNSDLVVILTPVDGRHVIDCVNDSTLQLSLNVKIIRSDNNEVIYKYTVRSSGSSSKGLYMSKADVAQRAWSYLGATDEVVKLFFRNLALLLDSHNPVDDYVDYLALLKQNEIEKKTAPSDLVVNLSYSDKGSSFANDSINAAEESFIEAMVSNNGKGTAFGVKLKTYVNLQNIFLPESIDLGEILPGETKKANVKVKAGLELVEGVAKIEVNCTESRGYDSKKYLLQIPTLQLIKPNLVFADCKINDGNTGYAFGNGNGIPENGETIELIPLLRNNGVGRAIKVDVSIASVNSGIRIVRGHDTLDEIQPGQVASSKLVVEIPRTYNGGALDLKIAAADVRGAADVERQFAFNLKSLMPSLAYSYKILPRGGKSRLQNGDEGEIEIIPVNNGTMAARDINLVISCTDLVTYNSSKQIPRIEPGEKYTPLRFSFKVPRNLEKDAVDIAFSLEQRDFSGLHENIHLQIEVVRPEFTVVHNISDANRDGVIEQGEIVDLIVRINNRGGLDAENVTLKLDLNYDGVVLQGPAEHNLGRLAADSSSDQITFPLNVTRRAAAGSLPLKFTISQSEFSSEYKELALNIAAEKAEVITVAGKPRPESSRPAAIAQGLAQMPPILMVSDPADGLRVAKASSVVRGVVQDDRGIDSIEIRLNGRLIDDGRSVVVSVRQPAGVKRRRFNVKVPLAIGKNIIEVTVRDIDNLSQTETITVYREAQRGEIYAAVIGINNYQNVPDLKYAAHDARAFAAYMRESMGLDNDHLFELYDSQATERNIESLLGTKLYQKADRKEDTIFIYFAGHGAPEKDPSSRDGDSIRKYILAHDTDLKDLYSTGIPMDTIAELFRRYKAQRVVFLSDSCYSGGSGGRTVLASASGWRAANISDEFLERIARAGKGRIILTSSSAREVSQESDKLGHGYFTYYLLEGLRGAADLSGDGEIDVDEIYNYLNRKVPAATGGTQHPMKKGEAEGLVIMGRN